jgi:hypothetical protein
MNPTRRRLVTALAATPLLGAAGTRYPDLILHHGRVITIDPARPRAEAIAIWGDRILHVGSNDDVLPSPAPPRNGSTSNAPPSCPASSTHTRTRSTPACGT